MQRLRAVLSVLILCTAPDLPAATPKDTLVIAWAIDDLITLDPAESFEFSGAEYIGNTYDRLIGYAPDAVATLYGVAAERWTVSQDGKTYTFYIRPGITFASGNPLTAEDAAFSLQRVIKLNKAPAAILAQFGFTPENVGDKIRVLDPLTLVIETDQAYAPTFLLYCLTATPGAIVDRREVLSQEHDGDWGHAWLRTHSAGSGPFRLRTWKPNEVLVLERREGYWGGAAALRRVVIRHISEPATQRLLLEKGDIDIARTLGPDQLEPLQRHPAIGIRQGQKGALYYLALNQKHPTLAKPQVRQAFKYLVDYQGIAGTLLRGRAVVHQAFLPKGILGALVETPFRLDIEKAKALLAEAGLSQGFSLTLSTRNSAETLQIAQSLQATLAKAGIRLEIVPGDNKQILTQYRARRHQAVILRWSADYQDPHANAAAFASNPDNSDTAELKTLAWRNAWEIPAMTQRVQAAVLERDTEKRVQLYQALQREHQETAPFIILFQEIEVLAQRRHIHGLVLGPTFDMNRYSGVSKD